MLILFWACNSATREYESAGDGSFSRFTISKVVYYDSAGDCSTDTSRLCTRVAMDYPVLHDSERPDAASRISRSIALQAANNLDADTLPYSSVKEMATGFISTYLELQRDFPSDFGWELKVDGEVLRNDAEFLVVKMESYSYAGGAHGNHSIQYTTYSSQTGKPLALDNILPTGFKDELNRLALEEFLKSKDLPHSTDLQKAGYTFPGDIYYNPANFAYLENEIIFYFNQYEIAPYSAGPTEIRIKMK